MKQVIYATSSVYCLLSLLCFRILSEKQRIKMVFCYQNCFDLLWEKNVLVNEKIFWNSRLKAENLQSFEITRTIHSNSERSEECLVTECFFNLFLEVSQILWIRTTRIQIGKIIVTQKHASKVRKYYDQILTLCFPNTANHKATQLRPLSSFPEIDSKSEIWFCSCYSAVVGLLSIRPTEKILISW